MRGKGIKAAKLRAGQPVFTTVLEFHAPRLVVSGFLEGSCRKNPGTAGPFLSPASAWSPASRFLGMAGAWDASGAQLDAPRQTR